MVVSWPTLGAAGAPPRSLLEEPQFLLGTAALVGVLLAGAMVIALARRWRQRSNPAPPTTGDRLGYFRQLYERGELSREEFEEIRGKLAQEIKAELQVPPPPAASPLPPEPPTGNGPAA